MTRDATSAICNFGTLQAHPRLQHSYFTTTMTESNDELLNGEPLYVACIHLEAQY